MKTPKNHTISHRWWTAAKAFMATAVLFDVLVSLAVAGGVDPAPITGPAILTAAGLVLMALSCLGQAYVTRPRLHTAEPTSEPNGEI